MKKLILIKSDTIIHFVFMKNIKNVIKFHIF
jgi:hypothetical protein